LLQEAVLDAGQRLRERLVPLAALGHAGKDGVFVVVELLLEVGGIPGRIAAGDVLLPVGQSFAEEVMCVVFLLDDGVKPVQVMVGVALLLSWLLPRVMILEADSHLKCSIALTGSGLVEHLFLLIRGYVDE